MKKNPCRSAYPTRRAIREALGAITAPGTASIGMTSAIGPMKAISLNEEASRMVTVMREVSTDTFLL